VVCGLADRRFAARGLRLTTLALAPYAFGRRQREPEGRSPARTRRQGQAQRRPRQGGLRVGVGERCNRIGTDTDTDSG
jgi:hypothetical protein